jgi:hypothetical protein
MRSLHAEIEDIIEIEKSCDHVPLAHEIFENVTKKIRKCYENLKMLRYDAVAYENRHFRRWDRTEKLKAYYRNVNALYSGA